MGRRVGLFCSACQHSLTSAQADRAAGGAWQDRAGRASTSKENNKSTAPAAAPHLGQLRGGEDADGDLDAGRGGGLQWPRQEAPEGAEMGRGEGRVIGSSVQR